MKFGKKRVGIGDSRKTGEQVRCRPSSTSSSSWVAPSTPSSLHRNLPHKATGAIVTLASPLPLHLPSHCASLNMLGPGQQAQAHLCVTRKQVPLAAEGDADRSRPRQERRVERGGELPYIRALAQNHKTTSGAGGTPTLPPDGPSPTVIFVVVLFFLEHSR